MQGYEVSESCHIPGSSEESGVAKGQGLLGANGGRQSWRGRQEGEGEGFVCPILESSLAPGREREGTTGGPSPGRDRTWFDHHLHYSSEQSCDVSKMRKVWIRDQKCCL